MKFTGKNREAAKFIGVPPEEFKDPGFCLGCGEDVCECEGPDDGEGSGKHSVDCDCDDCEADRAFTRDMEL